jgi:Putative DNA-binding domain
VTANFADTRCYAAPKARVFEACLDVMQPAGFKVTASDPQSGTIDAISSDGPYSHRPDSGFLEEVGLLFLDRTGVLSRFREHISIEVDDDGNVHACSVSEPSTVVLDQGRNRKHVVSLWNALDRLLLRSQSTGFPPTPAPYGNRPAVELATLPEDKFLEHKHAFAFSAALNRKDTILSDKILDRICGFWNTEGGTVLVGVEDRTGRIVGLDGDVKLFKDLDGLVNHVSNKIHQDMTPIAPFISIRIELARGKPVLRIDVPAGDGAIFRQDRFYVRENNTTRELKGQSLLRYLQSRWPRA